MTPTSPSTRRSTRKRTDLRRTPKQAALRVAKNAARSPRLKEEAPAHGGVALLTGVLSLFAFTIAASVVGVALLVASYWGEERARDRKPKPKGAKGHKLTLLAE